MEQALDAPDSPIDVDYTDEGGHTGFFLACLDQQLRAARLMKNRGANAEFADATGTTPFWAAAEAGNLGIVKFLHEQCSVATDTPIGNGATPLHAACHQGHVEVVKYLVEQVGVDTLSQARNGATPFFIACYAGEYEVARYLGDLQIDMYVTASNGTSARDVAERFNHYPVCQYVDRACGSSLSRPVRACMTEYLSRIQERGDGNCQLRTHTADMCQAAMSFRHVLMTGCHTAAHATMCYLLPICVRILGKRKGGKLWKSFQGLQGVESQTAGQGFLKDMKPAANYQSLFGEGSDASKHVIKAGEGDEEHGWNAPDAGKGTALIIIPGGGEAGRKACEKKAAELEVFIECHEQVRQHVRVAAYDSRINKHEKLDRRKDANILVITMDCLRSEVQESMAVAEMNPGGYDTAHLLQGAFAAFVPVGATSQDKSWLRIFTNLTTVVLERPEEYTQAAVKSKYDPPTIGRNDEEEKAAQARLVASNASVAVYHLLKVAKGLGAKPTAILMAKKMGEPIEHWDQLLIPQWGESLPVIIKKDGERTVTDWSPKRKNVGSGEKEYVVKKVLEEPKAAVPRRNLPRYIIKAKRAGDDDAGGKIYKDANRFKQDMLTELRRQLGTPIQKVETKDLYESVFCGFIVHLTVEEVNELKRMPDVDKVEKTGAKFDKTAPRDAGKEGGGEEQGAQRRLSNNAWSRHLGKRGEESSHNFAWFAPTMTKHHASLASGIGAEPPGRPTFADTSANVGRKMDAHDRLRRQRERDQAREMRRRAAVGRRRAPEVDISLSDDAARNLKLMEERSLNELRAATHGKEQVVAKKREAWSPAMEGL